MKTNACGRAHGERGDPRHRRVHGARLDLRLPQDPEGTDRGDPHCVPRRPGGHQLVVPRARHQRRAARSDRDPPRSPRRRFCRSLDRRARHRRGGGAGDRPLTVGRARPPRRHRHVRAAAHLARRGARRDHRLRADGRVHRVRRQGHHRTEMGEHGGICVRCAHRDGRRDPDRRGRQPHELRRLRAVVPVAHRDERRALATRPLLPGRSASPEPYASHVLAISVLGSVAVDPRRSRRRGAVGEDVGAVGATGHRRRRTRAHRAARRGPLGRRRSLDAAQHVAVEGVAAAEGRSATVRSSSARATGTGSTSSRSRSTCMPRSRTRSHAQQTPRRGRPRACRCVRRRDGAHEARRRAVARGRRLGDPASGAAERRRGLAPLRDVARGPSALGRSRCARRPRGRGRGASVPRAALDADDHRALPVRSPGRRAGRLRTGSHGSSSTSSGSNPDPSLRDLEHRILTQDDDAHGPGARGNLPSLTPTLVGRDDGRRRGPSAPRDRTARHDRRTRRGRARRRRRSRSRRRCTQRAERGCVRLETATRRRGGRRRRHRRAGSHRRSRRARRTRAARRGRRRPRQLRARRRRGRPISSSGCSTRARSCASCARVSVRSASTARASSSSVRSRSTTRSSCS